MTRCPHCTEEIPDTSLACPVCGRPLAPATLASAPPPAEPSPSPARTAPHTDGMGCLLAVLSCGLLILWAYVNLTGTPSSHEPSAHDVRRAAAIVERDHKGGLIRRFTCFDKEAFVDPGLWSLLHAEGKRTLTTALAAVCYGQVSGYRMTIKDAESALPLATFAAGRFEER